MQRFASACQRRFTALALITLALLLALPIAAGAQDMMGERVFASIRVYDGVDTADQAEILRLTGEGFLPIMRGSDGFVGYYLLPAEDMLVAISLFESAEQASASNEKAREFVAENLAPLLPNAPMIVEGKIDVSTQLMVDFFDESMSPEDMALPLYAALRIYSNYDMTFLDEANHLVETILLPAQMEAGRLFTYFSMTDGADTVVGFSVFDSEAGAQTANEIAASFVAEHLADFLPDDPVRVNGRLGIAVREGVLAGVNAAAWELTDEAVFASVRVYEGVDPADQAEIARRVDSGFLPIMRGSDGFVGYFLLSAGDKLVAISHFGSAEQAAASNLAARDFVAENLASFLPNPPTIFEGPLSINHVAALGGSADHGGFDELYASIRFYDGFDLAHFEAANELALAQLLPALQELAGFFALFALNDGEDTVVGISIFAGEESALASNDVGKAFTMEYLAEWAPNPPTGVSGEIAVASLAALNLGENLVGALLEG